MSVTGHSNSDKDMENVLSLFGVPMVSLRDPLCELLIEAQSEAFSSDMSVPGPRATKLVSEDFYPEQSMYILDLQMAELRESVKRIKFYMGDLEDLLPY